VLHSTSITNGILIPKYYNPEIELELDLLHANHKLLRIGDLEKARSISMKTGVEVGKMAYGTGKIPFIRTSDLSNWEIKADYKHGVSKEIYDEILMGVPDKSKKAKRKTEQARGTDVRAGDILLVRDGTYLIGTSAIVTANDLPMLYQSHIIRIRVEDEKAIDPWLLFASLNTPVVKKQIRAKQFTQDIIDTIGKRLSEVIVPIPHDADWRKKISEEMKYVIEERAKLRARAQEISLLTQGLSGTAGEEDADTEVLYGPTD